MICLFVCLFVFNTPVTTRFPSDMVMDILHVTVLSARVLMGDQEPEDVADLEDQRCCNDSILPTFEIEWK